MITFDKSEADRAIRTLTRVRLTDNPGDPEHVLHEICHAVILGAKAPFVGNLTAWVAEKLKISWFCLNDKTLRRADWQEILTCAAELRAVELLGWDSDPKSELGRKLTVSGVLNANVNLIEEATAERLIARLVDTEASYRRARQALDFAVVTAERYR